MSRLSFDVYVPEMSTNVSSGSYRVYSNKDGGHCKWEDLLYTAIDDGYLPEVDLSFRLGTLPPPEELNSMNYQAYDGNGGLEMIVHNKYKARGLSGSAKVGGVDLISISEGEGFSLRPLGIDIYATEEDKNPTEPRLSYISTGDGAKTMSVTLRTIDNLPTFHGEGMDEYIAINEASNNDLSGTVMKIHRYDEKYDFWRQADHDSITLFYPFGK